MLSAARHPPADDVHRRLSQVRVRAIHHHLGSIINFAFRIPGAFMWRSNTNTNGNAHTREQFAAAVHDDAQRAAEAPCVQRDRHVVHARRTVCQTGRPRAGAAHHVQAGLTPVDWYVVNLVDGPRMLWAGSRTTSVFRWQEFVFVLKHTYLNSICIYSESILFWTRLFLIKNGKYFNIL